MITSRAPRRVAALITVGAAVAVAWIAPVSSASASGSRQPIAQTTQGSATPERAAVTAINDITATSTADPLAGIPADFANVMGYRPTTGVLADGEVVAINPGGGCSVIGGGKPFDLSTVCKAHDLGYDLLRYAQRRGHPLGTGARVRIDNRFGTDLTAQCAARYRGSETSACDAMAATFVAGVGFNSWRQEYGPPIATSGTVRTIGVLAVGLLIVYFLGRAALMGVTRCLRRSRKPLCRTLDGATTD